MIFAVGKEWLGRRFLTPRRRGPGFRGVGGPPPQPPDGSFSWGSGDHYVRLSKSGVAEGPSFFIIGRGRSRVPAIAEGRGVNLGEDNRQNDKLGKVGTYARSKREENHPIAPTRRPWVWSFWPTRRAPRIERRGARTLYTESRPMAGRQTLPLRDGRFAVALAVSFLTYAAGRTER